MKTLHLYLLRQAIATLVMTVCVFGFILLLGNVLKDILPLLVNRQASLWLILKAIALLLPWIMAWALPMALLTAMLLLFGRLSADNELTAVKASGVSLLALIAPLLILSVVMSGLCAWFNLQITPAARVTFKRLLTEVNFRDTDSLITEDRFIDEIPNYVMYIRKKHPEYLQDVIVYALQNGEIISRTTSPKATLKIDAPANKAFLHLNEAITEQLRYDEVLIHQGAPTLLVTNLLSTNLLQTLISNDAPRQVIGKTFARHWQLVQADSDIILDLPTYDRTERTTKISEMSFTQLRQELIKRKRQGITATPALIEMHRQVAFSFACFAFTLVAIPLGIRAHRRETSIGMAIALGLVFIYYCFQIVGQALEAREHLHPYLIFWIPNLLFQTIGATLLWRANRKG